MAGYSEGGFCAANLALQYRRDFGVSGVMSGYFSPLDVLVRKVYTQPFPGNPLLRNQNTPLYELPLIPTSEHIPQFWIGAGASDGQDVQAARQFETLLLPHQPSLRVHLWPGGGHNGLTWRGLLTPMLEWMTTDLAAAKEPGGAPASASNPPPSGPPQAPAETSHSGQSPTP
jgi:enterochelin esterase-like enzyme